ncbi:OLC1v1037838C2 [Oldenlandia corymbosa var. corymbosa]|uniref:Mechanosensitive ion channel protein n=1 Tax=Oldenlandia corymbosa var. corymbosa TaxID=529605 RepID=A0AAV1CZ13_OLDCO|nr:OLC1v1037838C2 [Oldenlandia corymbosa var. corymbosa]
MEGGKDSNLKGSAGEVVVMIPNPQATPKLGKQTGGSDSYAHSDTIKQDPLNIELIGGQQGTSGGQLSSISPGTSSFSPVLHQTPTENSMRRRLLKPFRSPKPKSRLVEPPPPPKLKLVEERIPSTSPYRSPMRMASPGGGNLGNVRASTSGLVTPRTPLMSSQGNVDEDDEDDDDVYQAGFLPDEAEKKKHGKKVKFMILIEWVAFFVILGFLVVSLCVDKLAGLYVWGLRLWRWSVLVLVIFCGHLVTQWLTDMLVFVIERNYLLKNKVLYFLYSLRKSFRVSLWLGLTLLAWGLLINRGVKKSRKTMRILNYITRGIASSLIGAVMWMVKTFLVKLLASSFQVQTFFDMIQDTIFHQYVLQTLSGPPLMERTAGIENIKNSGRLSFKYSMKGNLKGKGDEVVDVNKLHRMKKEKISSWTMGALVQVIRGSGLSTLSDALDSAEDEEVEQKEITSEYEARAAAKEIFKRVAKSGRQYIEEEDLLRFFPMEEVDDVILLFQGAAENGQIKKSSFKNWVVKVYTERKLLAHSLNDTKTAIEELNKVASGIILVIIIIVWLLLMGFASTKVLVFISSQILLLVFMFGNTAKTCFEALMFVFVTHPFDVGDKCIIDGVQMVVEEMNILTTIFLRYDNQMIYYPNSVLAGKPITNLNRSPPLGDSLEFSVDFSTSVESIAALKDRIKRYVESKPQHWQPNHSVVIREIEDMNKLKMALYVTHSVNASDRSGHRSDLVMELKKTFEELDIKYHLLPQEVHVRYLA